MEIFNKDKNAIHQFSGNRIKWRKNTDRENSFNITRLQIFMYIAGKKGKIEIPSI